ncbi:hypothetical protein H696_03412 [Fonticula alba]|uniref:Uncharacterized protein n=1 Tax=Fonticula alba TaxID=691883 RepID=A0A058Z8U6_FONAL|nr:hypothetical protein H696_03412 [Fonticula alba]KCV69947.1 hypothetical protein H696_03412 [Fonticula alba]|eukprot:XP_009495553.1 hypothetical protein H696_03412 [Fonticula alba]
MATPAFPSFWWSASLVVELGCSVAAYALIAPALYTQSRFQTASGPHHPSTDPFAPVGSLRHVLDTHLSDSHRAGLVAVAWPLLTLLLATTVLQLTPVVLAFGRAFTVRVLPTLLGKDASHHNRRATRQQVAKPASPAIDKGITSHASLSAMSLGLAVIKMLLGLLAIILIDKALGQLSLAHRPAIFQAFNSALFTVPVPDDIMSEANALENMMQRLSTSIYIIGGGVIAAGGFFQALFSVFHLGRASAAPR